MDFLLIQRILDEKAIFKKQREDSPARAAPEWTVYGMIISES
jgi:hypothetical protein